MDIVFMRMHQMTWHEPNNFINEMLQCFRWINALKIERKKTIQITFSGGIYEYGILIIVFSGNIKVRMDILTPQ